MRCCRSVSGITTYRFQSFGPASIARRREAVAGTDTERRASPSNLQGAAGPRLRRPSAGLAARIGGSKRHRAAPFLPRGKLRNLHGQDFEGRGRLSRAARTRDRGRQKRSCICVARPRSGCASRRDRTIARALCSIFKSLMSLGRTGAAKFSSCSLAPPFAGRGEVLPALRRLIPAPVRRCRRRSAPACLVHALDACDMSDRIIFGHVERDSRCPSRCGRGRTRRSGRRAGDS